MAAHWNHTKNFTFFLVMEEGRSNMDDALASGLEQELSSSEMGGIIA